MLPRRLALAVLALGIGAAFPATPAAGAAPGGDRVSRGEYRAIHDGMTREQLSGATHDASFTADRSGHCVIRFYRGWDREHYYVGVALDAQRRVADKDAWAKNDGWFLGC